MEEQLREMPLAVFIIIMVIAVAWASIVALDEDPPDRGPPM